MDDFPDVRSLTINIKQPWSEANELDELCNFPSLSAATLPAISDVTGYEAVKENLTTCTTLEKVPFTLIGETGEGWSKVLDELMSGSSFSYMGLKIYGSLSQPALQVVKNLLLTSVGFLLLLLLKEICLTRWLLCEKRGLVAQSIVKFLDQLGVHWLFMKLIHWKKVL